MIVCVFYVVLQKILFFAMCRRFFGRFRGRKNILFFHHMQEEMKLYIRAQGITAIIFLKASREERSFPIFI